MDFKDSVKLLGDFHHIEISPTATIELGTDVTLRSFISLEVSDNAKLTLGNRVFFNDPKSFIPLSTRCNLQNP